MAREKSWQEQTEDDYIEVLTKRFQKEEIDWGLSRAKLIPIVFCLISLFLVLFFFLGCAWADDMPETEKLVNAIYLAEGGKKAKFPYGIRSVSCDSKKECRQVCKNTVKKNKIRFIKYGRKTHRDFISFLASRYCPIGAENDKKGINKNWEKNVRFYLSKLEVKK